MGTRKLIAGALGMSLLIAAAPGATLAQDHTKRIKALEEAVFVPTAASD